ncbi:hypothetical protein BDN67DRAFT_1010771 [Paxillus ammoniavirescens]|nr:hypothetical protein BDN67DRAFT_1010771 [Paxillus ammoniavirescens]
MATYFKDPRQESSTTTPIGMPYDKTSNREGPGGAVGGDEEVEGSDDEMNTLEVEGGHKVERMENEVERHNDATNGEVHQDGTAEGVIECPAQMPIEEEDGKLREQMGSTSNIKENEQDSPRTPPEPPPPSAAPPAPSPNSPEWLRNNETTTMTTSTPQTADTLHDPDGEMKVTLSVQLKGERIEDLSRYIELTDIKTNDVDAEEDRRPPDQSKMKKPSRNPVGTTDGDERCPNEPTEPPDKEEGERRGNKDEGVERDEPGDKGNEDESRGVEGEAKG